MYPDLILLKFAVDPDLNSLGFTFIWLSWIRILCEMRIRIQEHGN
jgi:hypothetical protein